MNELLLLRALSLMLPLIGALVVHGVCLKFNLLASLARPLDGGLTFRGRRLFGPNKTWRGIVVVALGGGMGFVLRGAFGPDAAFGVGEPAWLRQPSFGGFAFGVVAGGAAALAELPNSFAKRQLGIAPGAAGRRAVGVAFFGVDQLDMLAGYGLVLAWAVPLTPALLAASAALFLMVHPLLTLAGYAVGARSTWR